MKQAFCRLATLFLFLFTHSFTQAASPAYTIGDFISNKANGSWSNAADWSIWDGVSAVPQALLTPTALSNVYILAGHTYTLPLAGVKQCNNLTIETGGKLYANTSTSNHYLDVYGSIVCDGVIGNNVIGDGISFNIEGAFVTISGSGEFDGARIRKNNATNSTTNLTFNMNVNLRFSGTDLYNNVSSTLFNITIAPGITVSCLGDGTSGSSGGAAIDGTDGNGIGYMGGSWQINGTLMLTGNLYLTTNNTNPAYSVSVAVGSTGILRTSSLVCSNSSEAGSMFTIYNGGVLDITGEPVTYAAPGLVHNTYVFYPEAVVRYTANIDQTIYTFGTTHYSILECSGGTKHLFSDTYIDGNLLLADEAVLSIGSNVLTLSGNVSGAGTFSGTAASGLLVTNNGSVDPLLRFNDDNILHTLGLAANAKATLAAPLKITAGANAGSVTVASGAVFTTDHYLTLQSDQSGTASIGPSAGILSGKVTVERYIPAHRAWRLLSIPFISTDAPTINQGWQEEVSNTDRLAPVNPHPGYGTEITQGTTAANGYDQGSTTNPSLLYYNESGWTAVPSTHTAITDYPAYMLFVRGDRSVIVSDENAPSTSTVLHPQGQLQVGSKTINVSAAGWQLIGNPYASAIRFADFYNTNRASGVLNNSYYVWDPELTGINGVGAYVALTEDGTGNYIYNVHPASPIDFQGRIESGSAFFINAVQPGSLVFDESMKSAGSAMVLRPAITAQPAYLRASLSSINEDHTNTLKDGVVVLFGKKFTNAVNVSEDVYKLFNSTENISLQKESSYLAIEKRALPEQTDTLQLDLTHLHPQHYLLQIEAAQVDQNMTAFLYDRYKRVSFPVDLKEITTDSFTVTSDSASFDAFRFQLVLCSRPSPQPAVFRGIGAVPINNMVQVKWKVSDSNTIGHFETERSADGTHFYMEKIISADASYSWMDEVPLDGTNYYRIKLVRTDGTAQYSPVVQVPCHAAVLMAAFIQGSHLVLQWKGTSADNRHIRLLDPAGRLLFSQPLPDISGEGRQIISLPFSVAQGLYELQIRDRMGAAFTQTIEAK